MRRRWPSLATLVPWASASYPGSLKAAADYINFHWSYLPPSVPHQSLPNDNSLQDKKAKRCGMISYLVWKFKDWPRARPLRFLFPLHNHDKLLTTTIHKWGKGFHPSPPPPPTWQHCWLRNSCVYIIHIFMYGLCFLYTYKILSTSTNHKREERWGGGG